MAKKAKTIDERVGEVFAVPEPVEVAPVVAPVEADVATIAPETAVVEPVQSETKTWLVEAEACQAVYAAGNIVSPDDLKALVNRAIGLMGQFVNR